MARLKMIEDTHFFRSGKHGVYTTTHGLRIAFFSGYFNVDKFTGEDLDNSNNSLSPYFTSTDVSTAIKEITSATNPNEANEFSRGIDILITHSLPTQISKYASRPFPSSSSSLTSSVPAISNILAAAKPRYHFASQAATFWERDPFSWPSSMNRITRFISLGQFGNTDKQRYFYAFNLNLDENTTNSSAAGSLPPNITPCPLDLAKSSPNSNRIRKFDSIGWDDDNEQNPPNFIFNQPQQQFSKPNPKKFRSDNNDHSQPPPDYVCRICVRIVSNGINRSFSERFCY